MASISPSQIFPNMTATATTITIPLADLMGLTQAEVDPNTGDGREVSRIILETIVSKINALAVANRPTKMTVTKSNPQGIGIDQIRQAYTLAFDIAIQSSGASLVAEV